MAAAEISHGRGGAGNMSPDATPYGDGEIVRAGVVGSHGDGAYSSGRGGAGNISDIGTASSLRKDHDIVPEEAVRPSQDGEGHTGRGGAGNVDAEHAEKKHHHHHHGTNGQGAPVGLADKLKGKLLGAFKK